MKFRVHHSGWGWLATLPNRRTGGVAQWVPPVTAALVLDYKDRDSLRRMLAKHWDRTVRAHIDIRRLSSDEILEHDRLMRLRQANLDVQSTRARLQPTLHRWAMRGTDNIIAAAETLCGADSNLTTRDDKRVNCAACLRLIRLTDPERAGPKGTQSE